MKIVLLVLLFIYVVAFFWIIWKSAANWRWYQLVFASLAFLLTIPLLPLTAVVLKSRSSWAKVHEDLTVQLERETKRKYDLVHGVPGDPELDPGTLEMQGKLGLVNAEVGRVFRDMQVANRGPNGIVLAKAAPQAVTPEGVPADPAGDAQANPAPVAAGPLLPIGSIVYGFGENILQEGGSTLPVVYLGEYRVTDATPQNVTLVSTGPLEQMQMQAVQNVGSWALYELMPMDSHKAFIAPGSQEENEAIFGRVDEDLVRNLMANSVPAETLTEYLRDGSEGNDSDLPETKWMRIEFVKEHEVVVDAMEQRSAIDGGFFDGLGQAVDSRLQRAEGNSVTFKPGDQLVVKWEAGEQLTAQGIANLEGKVYVRPLNSYRILLKTLRQQIDYLNNRADNLRRQQAVLTDALALTTEMSTKGQSRKLELEKDQAQVNKELVAIQTYSQRLDAELKSTRQRLADLYQSNLSSERELESIQTAIRRAAEERAASATAAGG